MYGNKANTRSKKLLALCLNNNGKLQFDYDINY